MYKDKNHYTWYKRNGTWCYYCYDGFGKRHLRSTGKQSKAAALKVLNERIQAGDIVDDGTRTPHLFSEYAADLFLEGKCPIARERERRGKKPLRSWYKNNRSYLERHILPYMAKYPLEQITPKLIRSWQDWLEENGRSSGTVSNCFSTLRKIFHQAVIDEILDSDPTENVDNVYVTSERRQGFTREEITKIFSEEWPNRIFRIACQLSASTGMRIGEIIALKCGACTKDTIFIRESYSYADGDKTTKNGKERFCPTPQALWPDLEWIMSGRSQDDYVMSFTGEGRLNKKEINQALRDRCKAVGIEDYHSFHDFRHFFNTYLVISGVSREQVKSVIGHSSDQMTEHYLHMKPEYLEQVRKAQEELMK